MGKGLGIVLYIAVGVVVEEDDGFSCLEEVDEILDFLLAFVLKYPVIGWDIDLLSCLNVFKELLGAQSFLMTNGTTMNSCSSFMIFHRAVGEAAEVNPFVGEDLETLPDAFHAG